MPNAKANPEEKQSAWIKWGCLVIVVLGLLFYFYPRDKVELNDHGYDASMALYRICNQRDTESLRAVSEQIVQWQSEGSISERSSESLQRVVDLANAGDWTLAGRECRRIMEDQVQR